MPTIDERVREKAPPRFENQADRLAYLLDSYKTPLTVTVLSVVILFASGKIGLPEISPFWRVALIGVAAGSIPSAVVGKILVVDPFIDKPSVNVAELDVEDKGVDVQEIPKPLWNDRQEGERSPWSPEVGNIDYVVSDMEFLEDLNKLSVEGVNRELVDPIDLIVRDEKIDEIHQDLLSRVAEAERYKARERTRQLEKNTELATQLIAAVEHGLEFEPGTTEAIQENELEQFKDRQPERSESNRSDVDDDQPETLNQLLGYEEEQLNGSAEAVADGGEQQ